jgi:hypothetical protein
LLTREKWVALRANLGADHFSGRTRRPGIATGTNDRGLFKISGVNSLFHSFIPSFPRVTPATVSLTIEQTLQGANN